MIASVVSAVIGLALFAWVVSELASHEERLDKLEAERDAKGRPE